MTTVRFLLLLALLLVVSAPAFCVALPKDSGDDYWMGIFYAGQRMGYLHVTVKNEKFEGKDVLARYEVLSFRFANSGKKTTRYAERTLRTDIQMSTVYDYMATGEVVGDKPGPETLIEEQYNSNTEDVRIVRDGRESKFTQPLDNVAQVMLKAGWKYSLFDNKLKVGDELALDRMRLLFGLVPGTARYAPGNGSVKALRREKIEIDGSAKDTVVVSETTSTNEEIIRYQLDDGTVLKEEQPSAKVTLIRESREKAMQIEDIDGPDLDKPIDDLNYAELLKNLPEMPHEQWMGIYYGAMKVGYLRTSIHPYKLNGKDMISVSHYIKYRANDGVQKMEGNATSTVSVDKSFTALRQQMNGQYKTSLSQQLEKVGLSIDFEGDSARMVSTADGKSSERKLDVSAFDLQMLKKGWLYEFGLMKLKLGDKVYLNRPHMWMDPRKAVMNYFYGNGTLSVLRRESIEIDGESYDALVTSEECQDLRIMRWQLDNGDVLKEYYPDYGIALMRESKKKATEVLKGEEPDISKV